MCGIVGIVNVGKDKISGAELIDACAIINHRGPDDEGFLTWSEDESATPRIWAGGDTAESTLHHWKYDKLTPERRFSVGFGHRRLSILDLSPMGHQPMLFPEKGLAISFNGEVYNYLEIKAELLALGHAFTSTTDTEVILHAWSQWGPACLSRFNGMFAFLLLDYNSGMLYAVRDRFGVKPLCYANINDKLIIASEIKQIKTLQGFRANINQDAIANYIALGDVDTTLRTFDNNIQYVQPGYYMAVNLRDKSISHKEWYKLQPSQWSGGWNDAVDRFRELLTDSVKLRLRSDVTVGSCLSGGLDSSSIVCLAANILQEQGDFVGQETVTACYNEARYDEWEFAKQVIEKTKARPHRTFPDFTQLESDIDKFIWHQDEPTGSTSQFSQWAVFKKTHEVGLKVMIDGQGADEQLAGYGGNDLPLYAGLVRKAKFGVLLNEIKHYKAEHGSMPKGFLLGALQLSLGKGFANALPAKLRINEGITNISWLNNNVAVTKLPPAKSLKDNLLRQLQREPLPSLLRYEDRNSMAWSVESRTPFMDYRLVEFTTGLPEEFVYEKGLRKKILRSAMENILPPAVGGRKDKMGFVTPEEVWLKKDGKDWFKKNIEATLDIFPNYFKKDELIRYYNNVVNGTTPFDFTLWRILCLGRWNKYNA
jgi:asparagine synthase (glutamine-hydrolysing)